MGDVIGLMNGKRGSVLGIEQKGANQVVRALVPARRNVQLLLSCAPSPAAGSYSMQFSHYQELPGHLRRRWWRRPKGAGECARVRAWECGSVGA